MPSLIPGDRRVVRRRLERWIEPAVIHSAIGDGAAARFWLDSGIHAERGMSYLGDAEVVVTSGGGNHVLWHPSHLSERMSVLALLHRELSAPHADLLGWVGWLGYGVGAETTGLPIARDGRHPESAMLRVDRLVAVDHAARSVELICAGGLEEKTSLEWLAHTEDALLRASADPPPLRPAGGEDPRRAHWRDDAATYRAEIADCLDAITDGDAYQLCLTTEVTIDARIDPLETWLALRKSSPSHRGGFIELRARPGMPAVALLSASPETFLEIEPDGVVRTKPIKGTRARSTDPVMDAALAEELRTDEKELAENLMIVDLMRNDLGRVCAIGSVSVPSLFEVQSYAHVHQLVSTVEGVVAAGVHPVDVISSCFPAGSMTGAPKLRAMQLLDTLEGRARGIYSGAFGYLGVDGSVDLSMVIRSIVVDEQGAVIGAGGGITASSDPESERIEVELKAAALLAALGSE